MKFKVGSLVKVKQEFITHAPSWAIESVGIIVEMDVPTNCTPSDACRITWFCNEDYVSYSGPANTRELKKHVTSIFYYPCLELV
jgi:hypothetical protein